MINLMIVAHESVGQAYVSLVKHIFGLIPDDIVIVEVGSHENTNCINNKLKLALAKFEQDSSILILTDIFGATPCNVARQFVRHNRIVLTGLNASMVIKAIQYAPLRNDVNLLAEEVKNSAIAGVISISDQETDNLI